MTSYRVTQTPLSAAIHMHQSLPRRTREFDLATVALHVTFSIRIAKSLSARVMVSTKGNWKLTDERRSPTALAGEAEQICA